MRYITVEVSSRLRHVLFTTGRPAATLSAMGRSLTQYKLVSLVLLSAVGLLGCGTSTWGPLVVVDVTGEESRRMELGTGGTLVITDDCVLLQYPNPARTTSLLIWPAHRTAWNPAERAVEYQNLDGQVASLRSGEHVELGASADGPPIGEGDREVILQRGMACGSAGVFFVSEVYVRKP